jgi:hypothetical protein
MALDDVTGKCQDSQDSPTLCATASPNTSNDQTGQNSIPRAFWTICRIAISFWDFVIKYSSHCHVRARDRPDCHWPTPDNGVNKRCKNEK